MHLRRGQRRSASGPKLAVLLAALGLCGRLPAMYKPVLRDWIWAEGRGPELRRAHFRANGLSLIALDYFNPDWASEDEMRHLLIHRGQAHQYTPHEVFNYSRDEVRWGPSVNQAAVLDLGRSDWLLAFSQSHLGHCKHYRVMFYDEFLDIICENITAAAGPYTSEAR
jgi:hypothetical protein